MPTSSLSERLIGPLRRLAEAGADRSRSDGQLLTAFVQQHDPDAFETLVRRHGPMVLGVCRRVIRHAATADDAFQAVFVVLARRAAAVTPGEQVANFLFGVAYRTALKAKGRLSRLRSRETQVDAMPEPATQPDPWDDLRPVIDEELASLPDKLRLPVVLCDLEGRPQREVAKHLGLPVTTLANRLTAARRKLAARLTARGVTLAGGVVASVMSAHATQAVSTALLTAATRVGLSAIGSGPGVVPANVLELSEGVMHMLAVSKLKAKLVATLAATMLLTGAGVGLVKAEDSPPANVAKLRPDLSDAEFLKRVCDSLRGSPPTPTELGYFTADLDAAKRKKVVGWLSEEKPILDQVHVLDSARWSQLTVVPEIEMDSHRLSLSLTGTVNRVQLGGEQTARLVLIGRGENEATDDVPVLIQAEPEQAKPPAVWVSELADTTATTQVWTQRLNVGELAGSDEAFLNKVIDAARGGSPTRLEKAYFLADKSEKKREKLLDLILSDPAAAKKLGPDWKQSMLNPPMTYSIVLFDAGTLWADKLIDELFAAKKLDNQMLEALTLAATGRLPTDTEKKLATVMVAKQKDKKAAWAEVASTLAGTDEAKKHAQRLTPQTGVIRLVGESVIDLGVESEPVKKK